MDSEYLGLDETGGWKRGKGRVAESAHEDFEPESLFFKYLSKRHKKVRHFFKYPWQQFDVVNECSLNLMLPNQTIFDRQVFHL